MGTMTFKADLLPNSDLEFDLGSSDKKWNIYGSLTGYSSNAISWDSTNKKLQQTVSSSGAADVLSFAAGDGINLTGASGSLTIAAKTTLITPSSSTKYPIVFSNSTDSSGLLYKHTAACIDLSSVLADLELGNNLASNASGKMRGSLTVWGAGTEESASIDPFGGLMLGNSTDDASICLWTKGGSNIYVQPDPVTTNTGYANYYFQTGTASAYENRYLTYTTDNSASIGDSGMPVYATSNGEITSCTKADLQANIFVISDTAPADTSVIWLKPVSSSS